MKGADMVIIGAGGVARAMAFCGAFNGAKSLAISDIVPERAIELARALKNADQSIEVISLPPNSGPLLQALNNARIIANATPLGMKDSDPLPLESAQLDRIASSAVIFDAVYNVHGTPLEKAAREREIPYIPGIDMLLFQGVRAFEIWTNVTPDIETMKKVLQQGSS